MKEKDRFKEKERDRDTKHRDRDTKDREREREKDRDRTRDRERDDRRSSRETPKDNERERERIRERDRPREADNNGRDTRDKREERREKDTPTKQIVPASTAQPKLIPAPSPKPAPPPSSSIISPQSSLLPHLRHSSPVSPARDTLSPLGDYGMAKSGIVVCNCVAYGGEFDAENLKYAVQTPLIIIEYLINFFLKANIT